MEIAFRTKALRTLCMSKEAMDQRYGAEGGALLRVHLADLRAAEQLGDLPWLPLLSSDSKRSRTEAVVVMGAGLKIVFRANHREPPRTADGGIDWFQVERICIQRIEQTNG